ncbi:TraB/GumN family protein [Neorhizobium alkalisoli]|uniref:Polysaccharide biosynthesis protein GumN n=1 Tax=Neorhizobium alkalisoli TaxID=528178 RepID=A0A561QIV4_9HYPH|nr:TraB/GumN family protein [Neorhizobium alkalisoli]TWF50275.1 hypothetical protein FHW37_106237 [Neorhizobium alkalisoli]
MTAAFTASAGMFFKRAQTLTLWLAAAAPAALLATLFLVLFHLTAARAEEAAACGGHNLVEEMKANDPAGYQKLLAEGAKVPNGKGIFWKIEKPGVPTSYLLGTMHVSDPRVLKMPDGADAARLQANTIVVESDEVLDDKKAMAGMLAKPELTMFTDGTSIETLLSKPDLDLLQAGLMKRGIPLAAVSRMKPWMLMAFVSIPACETARKAQNAAFLDKQLALDAAAQGKAVKGLETFAEQLSTLAAIPIDQHMQSLIETIKLGPKLDDVFETMTDLYLSGDMGLTVPFLKTAAPEGEDEAAGYGDFEELVVRRRNHTMAERAAPILDKGGAFIAVGALHLSGDEGLVELFRKQGFTVTKAD